MLTQTWDMCILQAVVITEMDFQLDVKKCYVHKKRLCNKFNYTNISKQYVDGMIQYVVILL